MRSAFMVSAVAAVVAAVVACSGDDDSGTSSSSSSSGAGSTSSGSSSGAATASKCQQLAECCPTLPAQNAKTCQDTVALDASGLCANEFLFRECK